MRSFTLVILLGCCVGLATGCTKTRTSNTSRTGIEQLLLSNAVDQSLDRMVLPPLDGRKVFLDPQYLDSVDKGYIVGSLRQRLLNSGALLTDKKEDSEVTIEVCTGAVGTDDVDSYVGMPGIALPGPMPVELPEVRLFQKRSQFGTAKLNLVAYSTADGRLIFDSGPSLARSDDSNWSVLGIGPVQTGSVRDEVRMATSATNRLTPRTARASDGDDTVQR